MIHYFCEFGKTAMVCSKVIVWTMLYGRGVGCLSSKSSNVGGPGQSHSFSIGVCLILCKFGECALIRLRVIELTKCYRQTDRQTADYNIPMASKADG